MIEADTINQLPPHEREYVKEALSSIYVSGVIATQIRKEKERIIDGNADESIEDATKTLLEVRRKVQGLTALNDIAADAYKESRK